MNLSNVQSVCGKYSYLLDPSKDDAIMMKYDAMMMQYDNNDAVMVLTHNSVPRGRG